MANSPTGTPLMGASNADVEGTNRDRWRLLAWLSIDDVLDL